MKNEKKKKSSFLLVFKFYLKLKTITKQVFIALPVKTKIYNIFLRTPLVLNPFKERQKLKAQQIQPINKKTQNFKILAMPQ